VMVNKPKDERPETVKLGESINVVMLKVRRRLEERSGETVVLRTSEHNTKHDFVELFDDNNKLVDSGTAEDIRTRHSGLHTIQIVYSLLLERGKEPELVKLNIKGSSLGSQVKDPSVKTFYDHVGSFTKDSEGNKEHLRQFVSILELVKEQGKKDYFTMTFNRGNKLDEETQKIADMSLREVHEKLTEQDMTVNARAKAPAQTSNPHELQVPSIEYPEDDINPEDIPF